MFRFRKDSTQAGPHAPIYSQASQTSLLTICPEPVEAQMPAFLPLIMARTLFIHN